MHWEKFDKLEGGGELVDRLKPTFVIDTAAFHNVDKCEEDEILAIAVNAVSTGVLAAATWMAKGRYIYISTDFVFDGKKGGYTEFDTLEPVNVYGDSKRMGEELVLAVNPGNLVIRPSVLYGWNDTRLNFATWLLSELKEGRKASIVTDWFGAPTFADNLANAILDLMQMEHESGVFHLAGPDRMSRYDFAVRLAREFDLDENLIRPVFASKLGLEAPRPPDSCLSSRRARDLGIEMVGVDVGLNTMHSQRGLDGFQRPDRFKS